MQGTVMRCYVEKIYTYGVLVFLLMFLGGCAEVQLGSHFAKKIQHRDQPQSVGLYKVGNPYKVSGDWYYPKEEQHYSETGIASWYGTGFNGKRTANGERFDENELTAAHKTLPMPSLVRVTNLDNGKSLVLRINDRGPFKRSRLLDVSKRSAELLGFKNKGYTKVRVDLLARESKAMAQVAKAGKSTRGIEIAMNDRAITRSVEPYGLATQSSQNAGIQTAALQPSPTLKGHLRGGEFYPEPLLEQSPVKPTTIYVQAGSFTVHDNAQNLAKQMRAYGNAKIQTAQIDGKTFYRVRIAARSVAEADRLLYRVINGGGSAAIIVVD